MKRHHRSILWIAVCILLFCSAYTVRRASFDIVQTNVGLDPLPFTVEGALHFRLHRMVYENGGLPLLDSDINIPQGLNPRQTYSVGSEFVYGALARVLPLASSLTDELRILQTAWFCLGIPALACLIAVMTGSRWAGALGAALYAVSMASVVRSTGIELSRENFSVPFLIAHMACWAIAVRQSTGHSRTWRMSVAGSSMFLACAMMTWDLIQFYLILWIAVWILEDLFRPHRHTREQRLGLAIHLAVLGMAGLIHPYLRAHAFLVSPPMLMGVAWGFLSAVQGRIPRVRDASGWVRMGTFAVLLVALLFFTRPYAVQYGHFMDLLAAKLRWMNQKPADPSLLTFAQRIMWVPALHTPNWALTRHLFPFSFLLGLLGVLLFVFGHGRYPSPQPERIFYPAGLAVTLLAYILFVRFHVYLVLFISIFAAVPVAWLMKRSAVKGAVYAVLLSGCILVEAAHTLQEPWGRKNVYYPELVELTEYLQERVAPSPVLAAFGVSGSILAYGNCPILLHPKFETEDIRRRVKDFAYTLYREPEERFRDWATEEGALYYVHSLGSYASKQPEYQMRYMADALEPDDDVAAWLFETQPEALRYFQPIFENRKYRVFRIVTPLMEQRASELALRALNRLRDGQPEKAEGIALQALTLFPYEPLALKVADDAATESSRERAQP